jgi:DNA repair protein RadC
MTAAHRGPTAAEDPPRERLLRHGPDVLSDTELVTLVLRTGLRGRPAHDTARALLGLHGGLLGVGTCELHELMGAPGLGLAKAASLVAALEIGRRVAAARRPERPLLRDPADVYRLLHPRLRQAPEERFLALLLDGRHRILREVLVSKGTLTASLVHPREVFRSAIRAGAAGLILAHNHPSGDPSPSPEDREVTARLARAGELLGVPVLDHVVVAERGYTSFREEGWLDPTRKEGGATG